MRSIERAGLIGMPLCYSCPPCRAGSAPQGRSPARVRRARRRGAPSP